MSKKLLFSTFCLGLMFAVAGISLAQTTTTVTKTRTEAVQNADGSWTVIEYPVGKEVIVNLTPGTTISGAAGTARVMRSADGTKVWFDVNGIPAATTSLYAYAIDPSGNPTLLGPLTVTNGVAKAEFSTPMNQFMLALSPEQTLTTFDANAPIVFRSALPTGYAVVPRVRTGDSNAVASADLVASTYEVPLLNVPSFKDDVEVRVKFDGELEGLDGKAYLDPQGGKTNIKMRFGDMKKVPQNKRFVLWARSPEGQYVKLGQVVNTGKRDEGEIRSETALRDFGLFLTVEDAEVTTPTSRIYSVFTVPVANP